MNRLQLEFRASLGVTRPRWRVAGEPAAAYEYRVWGQRRLGFDFVPAPPAWVEAWVDNAWANTLAEQVIGAAEPAALQDIWRTVWLADQVRFERAQGASNSPLVQTADVVVVLNLEAVAGDLARRRLLWESWQFNQVIFEGTEGAEIGEWLRQHQGWLARYLNRLLGACAGGGRRSEAYESIGHWMKSAVKMTGWQDAARTLANARPALDDTLARTYALSENTEKVRSAFETAQSSLRLFTISASFGELLRLVGYVQAENYRKLERWFDADSLDFWEDPAAPVLDAYAASICHLVGAVAAAFGWERVQVYAGHQELPVNLREYFDETKLHFPPLSAAEGRDPFFALLPALQEPLINALTYLREEEIRGRLPETAGLKIFIEDQRSTAGAVSVRFVNPLVGRSSRRTTWAGIETTRNFMSLCRLATIEEPQVEDEHLQVLVRLHPQELWRLVQGFRATKPDRSPR